MAGNAVSPPPSPPRPGRDRDRLPALPGGADPAPRCRGSTGPPGEQQPRRAPAPPRPRQKSPARRVPRERSELHSSRLKTSHPRSPHKKTPLKKPTLPTSSHKSQKKSSHPMSSNNKSSRPMASCSKFSHLTTQHKKSSDPMGSRHESSDRRSSHSKSCQEKPPGQSQSAPRKKQSLPLQRPSQPDVLKTQKPKPKPVPVRSPVSDDSGLLRRLQSFCRSDEPIHFPNHSGPKAVRRWVLRAAHDLDIVHPSWRDKHPAGLVRAGRPLRWVTGSEPKRFREFCGLVVCMAKAQCVRLRVDYRLHLQSLETKRSPEASSSTRTALGNSPKASSSTRTALGNSPKASSSTRTALGNSPKKREPERVRPEPASRKNPPSDSQSTTQREEPACGSKSPSSLKTSGKSLISGDETSRGLEDNTQEDPIDVCQKAEEVTPICKLTVSSPVQKQCPDEVQNLVLSVCHNNPVESGTVSADEVLINERDTDRDSSIAKTECESMDEVDINECSVHVDIADSLKEPESESQRQIISTSVKSNNSSSRVFTFRSMLIEICQNHAKKIGSGLV